VTAPAVGGGLSLFVSLAPVCERDALKPASVADLVAFEALPTETRELARRVLGTLPVGAELLEEAYTQGWGDCADEFDRPYLNSRAASRAALAILRGSKT